MILIGKTAIQLENRKYYTRDNGMVYWRGDFFETPQQGSCTPQAYLVEQPAHIVNPTHFHVQNQFQLFTEGEGTFGRKQVTPYMIHYAGAYTGYGPIVSGDLGLSYITFRALKDPGAQFLPEKKANFKAGPKSHFDAHLPLLSEEALNGLEENECHWVKPPTPEGMAIALYRIPPNGQMKVNVPETSMGFFAVVLQGEIAHDGEELGLHENVFVSSAPVDFTLRSLNGPAEILTLHFPPTDSGYLLS
jgi:hypothetical protein